MAVLHPSPQLGLGVAAATGRLEAAGEGCWCPLASEDEEEEAHGGADLEPTLLLLLLPWEMAVAAAAAGADGGEGRLLWWRRCSSTAALQALRWALSTDSRRCLRARAACLAAPGSAASTRCLSALACRCSALPLCTRACHRLSACRALSTTALIVSPPPSTAAASTASFSEHSPLLLPLLLLLKEA